MTDSSTAAQLRAAELAWGREGTPELPYQANNHKRDTGLADKVKEDAMTVTIAERPYHMRLTGSRRTFALTSVEVERLTHVYPVLGVSPNKLTIANGQPDPDCHTIITPATLGGGPAFTRRTP